MTPSGKFVGIDVSKAQFDVAVRPTGEHWTSAHTEAGITLVVARLVSLRPTLVVLEATGGLEISLTGGVRRRDCQSSSSILGKFALSPKPRGISRRPIRWMPRS